MMKNKSITIPSNINSFFNLSSFQSISSFSTTLLPGLKHIPIPQDVTNQQVLKSFKRFKNSTYWQLYHNRKLIFSDSENESNYYNPKLINRYNRTTTTFYKMAALPQFITYQMNNMERDITSWMEKNPTKRRNTSEINEYKQLLEKYPSVIFKPADKNLGIVALDIQTYNEQILKHLDNKNNYIEVSNNTFQESRLLYTCLKKLDVLKNDFIFKIQELKYIKSWPSEQFKFPNFYVLPKIHKPGNLTSRPITGAVNWITTPISTILESRLQEAMLLIPNILKNSHQLVLELEQFNQSTDTPKKFYIITGDVNALYPSINQRRLIHLFNTLGQNKFMDLIPLIEFILENAYTKYNGKIFLQKNGIPMGTNAAVALANIYMGNIDEYITDRPRCIYYRRFIDDLFLIWDGTLEEWQKVANFSNKIIPDIQINWQDPSDRQIFLDIDIRIDPFNGKLITSPYQKPLNKYLYISPKSSHDRHTFKGFIKGELTRYAKLSSNPFLYQRTKELFYQRLLKRGYPRHFLYPTFRNHEWISRNYQKPETLHKILPFIIPYTFRNNQQELKNIFYHYGNIFCEEFKEYYKPFFVYSKSKSLGSYICSSSITKYHSQYLESISNVNLNPRKRKQIPD
jgi:hypothetical protein